MKGPGIGAPHQAHQNCYETGRLAAQYCDAHYGGDHFGVPNAPAAIARICLEATAGRARESVLDLGCSLGRATFELARGGFRKVTGLDFSTLFCCLATRMKEQGYLRYSLFEEGEIVSFHEATLADLDLLESSRRVSFHQADACNLPEEYRGFDLVLAANLIDRLHAPRTFLSSIHERLNPGGILAISSPYTWLEEYTKKEEWLGGYYREGEPVRTLERLGEILSPHFRMKGAPHDVPFVIRETGRKFQHSIAELTIWELR